MKYRSIIACICILGSITILYPALADEISLQTNQSDYYVIVGQDAEIPLTIQSSYSNSISGLLIYSITQSLNSQGFVSSFKNNQQESFSVNPGKADIALRVGSQTTPGQMDLDLSYEYSDQTGQKTVQLPQITIHFVDDENQAENRSNPQSSTTSQGSASKANSGSSQSNSAADTFAQMQQEMMQQMTSQPMSGSSSQPQSASQALQNNQMNANTASLAQQMADEAAAKEDLKQSLNDTIQRDPLYQKAQDLLIQTGYTEVSSSFVPGTDTSGSFRMQYKNPAGSTVQMAGEIQDGFVSSVKIDGNAENFKKE